jgi:D-lactate dehydrogenase
MRTAVYSTKSYDRAYLERCNATAGHDFTFLETQLNEHTVALAQGHTAVCVFVNDQVTAPILARLADMGITLIATRSAGFNHIDLDAARKHELTVVRVPAYSPHAVAEHAVALLLTLNRKVHKAYNRGREGNFSLVGLEGFDLNDKTVGVIGMGKIGRVFATIMRGFGCHVLAYDPYPAETEVWNYRDLDTLLREADILSLHCPLTPDTYHLIDAAALEQMKPTAVLINTSRGGLVDTPAVITALKKHRLGALAIDVYEQEENLFFEDLSGEILQDDDIARLLTFPNVLITAHQSFFTREALDEIARVTVGNLTAFENGAPENTVER